MQFFTKGMKMKLKKKIYSKIKLRKTRKKNTINEVNNIKYEDLSKEVRFCITPPL